MKADLLHLAGNLEGALARAELARSNDAPSRQRIAARQAAEYLASLTQAALRRLNQVHVPTAQEEQILAETRAALGLPPATPRGRDGGAPTGPTTHAPTVPAPGAREDGR